MTINLETWPNKEGESEVGPIAGHRRQLAWPNPHLQQLIYITGCHKLPNFDFMCVCVCEYNAYIICIYNMYVCMHVYYKYIYTHLN